MSGRCAKPECADEAAAWFVFAPAEQLVIRRPEAGIATVALCADHAERFDVPEGWQIEPAQTPDHDDALVWGSPRPETRAPRRGVWFAPDVDSEPATAHHPSAGGLLGRAFGGPVADRTDPAERPAESGSPTELAEVDGGGVEPFVEADLRIDERFEVDFDEYGTTQLPFPPAAAG